jgi:hypothetical protein
VSALVACAALSGCTSLRSIPIQEATSAPYKHVVPGREAQVVLRNGVEIKVHIVSADATGVMARSSDRAEPYGIAFSDMQSLHVRRFSAVRTSGVVAGAIAAAAGVLYLIIGETAEGSD